MDPDKIDMMNEDEIRTELRAALLREIELRKAISATLTEHANLADGDNCTLIRLKRVLG